MSNSNTAITNTYQRRQVEKNGILFLSSMINFIQGRYGTPNIEYRISINECRSILNRYSLFVIQNQFLFPPPTITFPAITPNNRPMTKPIFTLFKNIPIARPMISNVKKPIFLLGCMLLIFRKCYKVSQYFKCARISCGQLPEQYKAHICKISFSIFRDR
jgi:hypothetical protein